MPGNKRGTDHTQRKLAFAVATPPIHTSLGPTIDPKPRGTFLFIDFEKAYDTVDIDILLKKIQTLRAPPDFISTISSLFTQSTFSVRVNQNLSRFCYRTRGLPQGSILAPMLFNIYIDDLATELCNELPSIHDLPPTAMFADDVAIHGRDKSDLKLAWNIATDWAVRNKLKINLKKCGVVGCDVLLTLSSQTVPIREYYKYLGVPQFSLQFLG